MIGTLKERLNAWWRRISQRAGSDISTPGARRLAWWHLALVDHGWIRALWHNFYEVAPGIFRSNQPSPARLRDIHAQVRLRTVLNLRGGARQSFRLFEGEACSEMGLQLVDLPLSATKPPTRAQLEGLVEAMQTLPKPMLIHCKSGADRTGMAAALYLLVIEGRTLAEAKQQLSLRYAHVARSEAGVQDHILRVFEAAHLRRGISFMEWLRTEYDQTEMRASFARWRAGDRRLA